MHAGVAHTALHVRLRLMRGLTTVSPDVTNVMTEVLVIIVIANYFIPYPPHKNLD
jgi:hypothetical protein